MQKTDKIFFLKFYRESFFYKIVAIVINSMIVLFFLSSCNILFHKPSEIFFDSEKKIKKNTKSKKELKITYNMQTYYYQITDKKEKIHRLLKKSGVNSNEILKLIKIDKNLKNLKNGQKLFWKVNSLGKLLELQWEISCFQKKIYQNINNNFLLSNLSLQHVLIKKTILIEKNSNFFHSALQSGLKKSEIKSVIQALHSQVDFRKINTGSNFNLIFSHNLKNKKNILLGVKVNNFGKKYYSIRESNGIFYNLYELNKKTCPINLSFLKKYRISSPFSLHRIHPVTHLVTKHLGVDLAMPQGTPILATSNGKIIKIDFNKIAGLYVVLKNKDNYITRYMHLKKILVKIGDQIKIGQKIALSGNTGRTTGPHLHYEIWINNNPIDPIKFNCILYRRIMNQIPKICSDKAKKILKYLE